MTADEDALGVAGAPGFITAVGAFVIVAGLAVAGLRLAGGTPPEQGLEGAVGALALGAVVAAPGVLAMLALKDRPTLLLPAAIVLVPLSFISFALVTLPLLVPAGMLLVGYQRRSKDRVKEASRTAMTLAVVVGLLLAALAVLFAHTDPRSYTTPNGGGSTSDVITFAEALASLTLTAAAVASGWVASGRQRDDAVRVMVEGDAVDTPRA